jgi:hypothetical protein
MRQFLISISGLCLAATTLFAAAAPDGDAAHLPAAQRETMTVVRLTAGVPVKLSARKDTTFRAIDGFEPGTLRVVPLTPTELRLTGLEPGSTELTVTYAQAGKSERILVLVR